MNSLSILKKIGRLLGNLVFCVLVLCFFLMFEVFTGVELVRTIKYIGIRRGVEEVLFLTFMLFLIALAFFGLPKIQHKHYLLRYAKYMLYLTYVYPFIYMVVVPAYVILTGEQSISTLPPVYLKVMALNITAHILAYLVVWYGVKRKRRQ